MVQESFSVSTASLSPGDQHSSFSTWRPPIKLTGRGGAGNVHTTIAPREHTSSSSSDSLDNDNFSFISFRKLRFLSLSRTGNTKPRSKSCPQKAVPYGRGGAGNTRRRQAADSSDRPPPLPDITQLEQQYLLARDAWRPHQPQSSGRGGAGNISLPRPIARAVQVFVSVTKR